MFKKSIKKIKIFLFSIFFFTQAFSAVRSLQSIFEDLGVTDYCKISEGSEKEVFDVIRNGQREACLVFKNDIRDITASFRRFHREFKFLNDKKFFHQNIIKMIDYYKHENMFNPKNNYYLFFTEIGDKDLNYCIYNENLSDLEKIKILKDIISGVKYLHSKGVIHGDLKPGNIILMDDGNVRLIDFSYVKKIGEVINRSYGTAQFMSPELFEFSFDLFLGRYSKYEISDKDDVFAFGLIIYKLFYGHDIDSRFRRYAIDKKGFAQETTNLDFFDNECFEYMFGYLDLLKENRLIYYSKRINSQINKLIRKCLSIDPSERSTANEIYEELVRIEEELMGN